MFKQQFAQKSKLPVVLFISVGVEFFCELPGFWEIGCRDFCLLLNCNKKAEHHLDYIKKATHTKSYSLFWGELSF